jgi:broad specificity phosphatase PhoE
MRPVLLLAFAVAFPALTQEQDVQRALMQRDQQTAEIAARLRGAPLAERQRLENLSAQQLRGVAKDLPQELRPYERQQAAREHVLALPPPVVRAGAAEDPQPLPAKMPGVVDVVPRDSSLR